ncbi:MAG: hypothetical protein ACFFB5_13880 [Promethearchaeota archaeon]
MRFRINGNVVQLLTNQNWTNVFQQNNPYQRVGISCYTEKSLMGGWVNLPLSFPFEFEALSYTNRRFNNLVVLEITVERFTQLKQLSHQLIDSFTDYSYKGGLKRPLVYEVLNDFLIELPHFRDNMTLLLQKVETEFSWQDATQYNWNEIRGDINHYTNIVQVNHLPSEYQKIFRKLYHELKDLENVFNPSVVFKQVFKREFDKYSDIFEEIVNQYTKPNLDLQSLSIIYEDINTLDSNVKGLWEQINDYNRNYANSVNELKNELLNKISHLKNKIQNEYHELEQLHQLKQKRKAIEQTILQQLKLLTPGIQTLLTRISELTDIDKKIVEETIIRLLERFPDLGSYDKVSQVFILGQNMPTEINSILDNYPKPSFEDIIVNLEKGKEPDNEQLYFIVGRLHKEIESVIRTLVGNESNNDFKDNINQAFDQEYINKNEKDVLHAFRKARNILMHEEGESFPLELILNVKSILERL